MTTDESRPSADRHAEPGAPTGERGVDGSPAAQPRMDVVSVAQPLAPAGGDLPSDVLAARSDSQVNVHYATMAAVTVQPTKSVGIALLLTFLFGPFGMFYSTVSGAIFMIGVLVVGGFVAGLLTLGLAWIVWGPLVWVASMVWGSMAAAEHSEAPVISASLTAGN